MIIEIIGLIVIAAVIYFVVVAIRSKKKPQPVETVIEPETPPPVPQHKKEEQALVDRYRREIETNEKSEGCKALRLCVIEKIEEVTSKLDHQDVNRYWQSLMIRLEAFRAAYRGEPSYQYSCNVSRGVEFANTLIDEILELQHKS